MIAQRRLAGKPIMTPLEIIRRAQADTLIDEDGNVVTLELSLVSPAQNCRTSPTGYRVVFHQR